MIFKKVLFNDFDSMLPSSFADFAIQNLCFTMLEARFFVVLAPEQSLKNANVKELPRNSKNICTNQCFGKGKL